MQASVKLRHSLKTRITLATLTIFVAGIWSLSYYAHCILHDDIERLLGAQQYSAVSMVAEQVERELEDRRIALTRVAALAGASMQIGPQATQRFLQQRHDLRALFPGGYFTTGVDGAVTATSGTTGALAFASVGGSYADRDYVLGALRDDQTTIGQPTQGKVSKLPLIGMAAPVRDDHGHTIGALAGVVPLGMAGFLDQINEGRYGKSGGYLIISAQNQAIVAASDRRSLVEQIPSLGQAAHGEPLVGSVEGSGITHDGNGVEVLYSVKAVPSADWRVVVYLPTGEAFFPIRDMQQRLLLAALLLTLIAGVLTWWVLRRQLAPLQTTAQTLASGEVPRRALPVRQPDEIGQLVAGFNQLLEVLARREVERSESEEHFRLIFENSGDAIVFSAPRGPIETANPAACQLFGYNEAELRALGPSGFMDVSDPRLLPAIRTRDRTGHFRGELRARHHDGRVLDVEVISTCFCDPRGRIHTINQLRDISERKRNESAIILSEARLRRAELASGSGNWELRLGSRVMSASAGAVNLFGLDSDTADAARVKRLLLPEYIPLHEAALERLLAAGTPYDIEFRIHTADHGEIRDIHAIGQIDREHGIAFGIVQDISARKRSEARLKLAADVFSHVREGIMITDGNAQIVEVNDAFTRITGYTRAEALGQNPRLLRSPRQTAEFYSEMWRALAEQGYWSGEIWNRRKNGETYAQGLTISVVRDNLGRTQNYVGLFSDITETKMLQEKLQRIAHYDALSGLPNRVLLADRLQQALRQCHRPGTSVAVVYLDLDDFKAVNDRHGHGVGDALLVAVSRRMQDALRESDTLARIGGDEFVAVLTQLEARDAYQPAIERLLHAAAAPVDVNRLELQVSVSIGVTLYPQDDSDADLLLRHADQALYVAKQSGKNRYHLFDVAHDTAVSTQREGLQHIRTALEQRQLVLQYQPKVNMRSGTVVGAEALIRWQHPELGLQAPATFLPLIENDALAIDVGEWVIGAALAQIEAWREVGFSMPVSVNVGARQLQDPDFVERLSALLAAHPTVGPGDLEMEVLESSALDDLERVSRVIEACHTMGIKFALDDFGTGYSSLTYLKRLPVAQLKIDRSFVHDMLDAPDDLAILEGVIGLANAFRRELVAEGVETVEHGCMLLELGCELAQGYGIGRPMSGEELPHWASAWRPDPRWRDCRVAAPDELPLIFAAVELRAWVVALEDYLTGQIANPPTAPVPPSGLARAPDATDRQPYLVAQQQAEALAEELCALKRQGRGDTLHTRMGELHARRDAVLAALRALRGKAPMRPTRPTRQPATLHGQHRRRRES